MTGGGGAPRIFHRRRRRGFMVGGGGGVTPNERALKQRTRRSGVFSGFIGVSHFTCDLRWRRKVNYEYACFAQFHSLDELLIA